MEGLHRQLSEGMHRMSISSLREYILAMIEMVIRAVLSPAMNTETKSKPVKTDENSHVHYLELHKKQHMHRRTGVL